MILEYNAEIVKNDKNELAIVHCGDIAQKKEMLHDYMLKRYLSANGERCIVNINISPSTVRREWREKKRASYFSYLGVYIENADHRYTDMYTGNKEQRVMQLHSQLKDAYCKIFPEHYTEIMVFIDGVKTKAYISFSLKDRKEHGKAYRVLSDSDLDKYTLWAKQQLFDRCKIPFAHDYSK